MPCNPLRPPAPGIGPTIYGNLPRDVEKNRPVIEAAEIVTLHTLADPSDVQTAALVRRINPRARVWLAVPANYLSRLDLAKGRRAVIAEGTRISKVAVDMGAELCEPNGEGASSGYVVGDWTAAKGAVGDAEDERLETLGEDLADAILDAGSGRIVLGFTSHDGTETFRVPRRFLRRIALHSPQHYPAIKGKTASQRTLEGRVRWSEGQWQVLASRGEVEGSVVPYGQRAGFYLQGWGHSLGALVWGLCEVPHARLWACPGSWSAEGLDALRIAGRLRARHGFGPDAVERFQRAAGLEVDGIVGRATLDALRRL